MNTPISVPAKISKAVPAISGLLFFFYEPEHSPKKEDESSKKPCQKRDEPRAHIQESVAAPRINVLKNHWVLFLRVPAFPFFQSCRPGQPDRRLAFVAVPWKNF
jgi:hypothetical protein